MIIYFEINKFFKKLFKNSNYRNSSQNALKYISLILNAKD